MRSVLEVCVDSTASALAAKRGGASRLELCADLVVGGTTPSLALVRQVKAETGLPVRALLRPRFGDFCYDSYELAQMEQLAAELVALRCCNNDDCCQWQKQGEVVGAAASKTQARAKRMLGAATRLASAGGHASCPLSLLFLHRTKQRFREWNFFAK